MNNLQIKPGTYLAKPVRLTFGTTPGTLTPYVDVQFQIQGGEHDKEPIGRREWVTDRGTPVTMRTLLACGTSPDILQLSPEAWVGSIETQGTLPGFGDRNVLVDIQMEFDARTGIQAPRVRYVRPAPTNSAGSGGGREQALRALEAYRKRQVGAAGANASKPSDPEEEANDDGKPSR